MEILENRSTMRLRDEVAPTSGLPRGEVLTTFAKTPEILIPRKLQKVVDPARTQATAYTHSIGHPFSDSGYDANLAVIISEVLPTPYEQDPETAENFWNKVMEEHRIRALNQRKIDKNHRPLISIVAHSPDQMGVDMLYFVVAPELRRHGIGSDFYEQYEEELRRRGYHYIGGDNFMSTEPRFYREHQGRMPVTALDPYLRKRLGLDNKLSRTIKFLDDEFEKLVLEPKPLGYGQK